MPFLARLPGFRFRLFGLRGDAFSAASSALFFRQVTLPIIGLILLLFGLVGAGLTWDVTRSNAALMERQARMARMAVAASVDELAYQQQSDAMWQPLVDKVRAPVLDLGWMDDNSGGWLYRMFGHDWIILLDRQDRVVYASNEGRRVPDEWVIALRPALDPLIDAARGRTKGMIGPHDRRPGGQTAPGSTALTRPDAIHESDLALIGDRPAAASAMRIMASTASGTMLDSGYMLVDIRYLDGAYLAQLARRNLLDGLHFALTETRKPGEHSFPLFNGVGEQVGFFHWTPELPGDEILRVMVPGALIGLALLVTTLLLLQRSLWQSGSRLRSSLDELAQRNAELETERLLAREAQDAREAAMRREGVHLARERDREAQLRAEEGRRRDLLAVADRFEADVMGIVGSVGHAAEQLAVSAATLESLSAESGRQTGEAAERIDQVSHAAEGVADAIAMLSRSISQISQRADQQAELSGAALSSTGTGMSAMQNLVARAEGISDFNGRIDAIASRTNLLSINATIEAARAGEAGRGFTVVATEIKTLAAQAADATGEIGGLVGAVHASAGTARVALDDVSNAVGAFAQSADAIHASVSSQREIARRIEESAGETAQEAGSIAAQIQHVAGVAREAGHLSGQVAGAAQALVQNAGRMRNATRDFLRALRRSSDDDALSAPRAA